MYIHLYVACCIFHKRATNYRALLRIMTYKDKASYVSSPPCIKLPTKYILTLFNPYIGSEEHTPRVILNYVCVYVCMCVCVCIHSNTLEVMHEIGERVAASKAELCVRVCVCMYVKILYIF